MRQTMSPQFDDDAADSPDLMPLGGRVLVAALRASQVDPMATLQYK
jgi:hypothetical protein